MSECESMSMSMSGGLPAEDSVTNAAVELGSLSIEILTPEELLKEGDLALDKKDWNMAVDKMCKALEKKLSELGPDTNGKDECLGRFYLKYGDALLTKEEHSSELFVWDKGAEGVSGLDLAATISPEDEEGEGEEELAGEDGAAEANEEGEANEGDEGEGEGEEDEEEEEERDGEGEGEAGEEGEIEGEIDGEADEEGDAEDLQLAWENLEMARMCFSLSPLNVVKLGESEEERAVREKFALESSFATVRLADLLLLQERHEEALEEYRSALLQRQQAGLSFSTFVSIEIPIAQLLHSLGRVEEAREAFSRSQQLIRDCLAGVSGVTLDEDRRKNYELTLEELDDSIRALDEKPDEELAGHLNSAKEAAAEAAQAVRERMGHRDHKAVGEEGEAVLSTRKLEGEAVEVQVGLQEDPMDDGQPGKKKRRIVVA